MNEIKWITFFDYLIAPFVVGLIYAFAKKYRDKHYPTGHPYRKFFLPALTLKMFGAIVISFIYVYYYGFGDTMTYFQHGLIINSSADESWGKWLNLVLAIPDTLDPNYYDYIQQMKYYGRPSTYTVAQISSVFSMITFNTFIPTALLFSALAFSGLWALFTTFADLYPKIHKEIATCVLFVPSVALWGSGIFKDTLCIFGLGWLCFATFQLFVSKKRHLNNIVILIFSIYLIFLIKVYIIICFVPALSGWIVFNQTKHIRNRYFASIINAAALLIVTTIFIIVYDQYSDLFGEFSLEKIEKTSAVTRNYISYVSDIESGSAYSLGSVDPGLAGMLSKFPQAVNVTLFRPYLWESRKLIVFLNALESLAILLLTLKLLFTVGIKKIIKSFKNNYTIQFTFIFSIIFAFFVGVSSYNFGALSRYKIPCIPFYLLSIVLVYYEHAKPGNKLFKPLNL